MSHFVAIEGVEGSGKSTLIKELEIFARTIVSDVVVTREPGATEVGRKIREVLLDSKAPINNPICELMLFLADRAEHVSSVIRPALKKGAFVICDRFFLSTYAYQGYGRGFDLNVLKTLNEFVVEETKPDLTLLLDVDVKLGLSRILSRKNVDRKNVTGEWTKFEEESIEFHEKVRRGFLELAKDKENKVFVIDASQDIKSVIEQAKGQISRLLKT